MTYPEKHTYDQVLESARISKDILDTIDVLSYTKTSGSTGNIYIPLTAKYTYDQSQMFANIIVKLVHKPIPDYTSFGTQHRPALGKDVFRLLTRPSGCGLKNFESGKYSSKLIASTKLIDPMAMTVWRKPISLLSIVVAILPPVPRWCFH